MKQRKSEDVAGAETIPAREHEVATEPWPESSRVSGNIARMLIEHGSPRHADGVN